MTAVFNNIHSNGMVLETGFSLEWMCPIYKKNDRNEIANYRPITILNSDYKIMTKVLAQAALTLWCTTAFVQSNSQHQFSHIFLFLL